MKKKLFYLLVVILTLAGFLPGGLASISAPSVTAAAPQPSPLAVWHFDEGSGTVANDSSGNGYTGSFHGAPTWVPGIKGNALKFSENDYIDAGTSDVFNFNNGTGNFTIDAWIKPESMPSWASAIVAKATEAPYTGWSFYFYGSAGGKPPGSLGFGGNGIWEITSAPDLITVGTWVRVSVTKSEGTYTLYKNGIVVASTNHGNLETSTTSLKIGRDYPDGSPNLYGFIGLIDEVHIYNIALTAQQLTPTTVTTNAAGNITPTSARLSGNLTSLGTAATANVSFQWGVSSGNYTNETTPVSMNTTGPFSAIITNLSANTTYYFRAKAVGDNTTYGSDRSFTTLSTLLPGDANGDGMVNALDITKIERIIIGLDSPTPGADANQDGAINAIDITKTERLIAGLG